MTIGARIKLARRKAQMSMRELGKGAQVSATAISKFERGDMKPRQSTLLRLAKVLGVRPDYFFRQQTVGTLEPAYRKQSRLGQRAKEAIEADIIEQLERHLELMSILDVEPPLSFPQYKVETLDDVEAAAEALRREWELGIDPVEKLVGQLEDQGVKVLSVTGPKEFNGLACWANVKIPVIAFNQNLPGDRQRFTLAHELGHLVLRGEEELDPELAANRFAAAFIVPRKVAIQKLGRRRSNLSPAELRMLKQEYGMSIQAWIRRAHDLEIIDQQAYRRLFRQISTLGWRTNEPDSLPVIEPRKLQFLTHQAVAESLISPSHASYLLGEDVQTHRPLPTKDELRHAAEELAHLYATDRELIEFTEADLDE